MLTLVTSDQLLELALALRGQEYRRFYVNLAQKYYGPTAERIDVSVNMHWNDDGYSMGIGSDEETSGIRVFDDTGEELTIDYGDMYSAMLDEIGTSHFPALPIMADGEYKAVTTIFYVSDPFKGKSFAGVSAEGLELYATTTLPDHVRRQHDFTTTGGVQYQTFMSGPSNIVNYLLNHRWERRREILAEINALVAQAPADE